MPTNPYSPTVQPPRIPGDGTIDIANLHSRGLVGQVQILGVLMIVQGVFILLMGGAITFYASLMPMVFREIRADAAQSGNANAMPPEADTWFLVLGVIAGLVMIAIAVFTIICGVRTLRFRGRVMSIVMLCVGMVTMLTCYCLPTQIALSIYGMIVLFNRPVVIAFGFAEEGHSPHEIQRAFYSIP
ncbi:hypothetical protein [Novipirellula aureliae]|nr:hypothetical protein [Novipirellula aureliae]